MGADDTIRTGASTLLLWSDRRYGELARIAGEAGWRVVEVARPDAALLAESGASVAVVDLRDAFSDGLAAVAAFARETGRAGAALLALASRREIGRVGELFEAGATHFLLDPEAEEFAHALRFAGRRDLSSSGRRRDDPSAAAAGSAWHEWLAAHLAAGGSQVVARVGLIGFDLINEAYGRSVGDRILEQVEERLKWLAAESFGPQAFVTRGAGPEFLLAGDGAREAAEVAAERLAQALAEPFGDVVVGARIGTAASRPGEDAAALVARASHARLPASGGAALRTLAVELRHALATGRVRVLFQPQARMADGRIVGAEALARWDHPRLGEVGAEALFAAAAHAGLSASLSEHVQRRALDAAVGWPQALAGLRLSVNVTAEDLDSPDFADRFLERAVAAGFPAERLTAEVTETAPIAELPRAAAALNRLRGAGCRIAIDDFGAGYSSLAYLSALPLDCLKLDRTLVGGIERDGRERVVVRSVLTLARTLRLTTVAEGVETRAQRDLLANEGCELYQGFLCAGALTGDALASFVTRPPSPSPC